MKTPVASGGEYKSHYEFQIRDVVHAEGIITESDIQGYVFPEKRISLDIIVSDTYVPLGHDKP